MFGYGMAGWALPCICGDNEKFWLGFGYMWIYPSLKLSIFQETARCLHLNLRIVFRQKACLIAMPARVGAGWSTGQMQCFRMRMVRPLSIRLPSRLTPPPPRTHTLPFSAARAVLGGALVSPTGPCCAAMCRPQQTPHSKCCPPYTPPLSAWFDVVGPASSPPSFLPG